MPVVAMLLLAVCIGCAGESSEQKIERARKLGDSGNRAKARDILATIPREDQQWVAAQYLLGTWEMKSGATERALEYFKDVPLNGSSMSLQVATFEFEYHLKNCRLAEAVAKLEYLNRESAADDAQRSTLATILVLGGRRARADVHLMSILQRGQIALKDLVLLTQPERRPPESDVFLRCIDSNTGDTLTEYAAASAELLSQMPSAAITRLQRLLKASPEFAEGQALLGEALLDHDPSQFDEWASQLPNSVIRTPGLWFVRGLRARQQNLTQEAVRCFWETVRRDPLHRRAMFQLGQSVGSLDSEAGQAFAQRADLLQEGARLTERVLINEGQNPEEFVRFIEILMECGRHWEASKWIDLVSNDASTRLIPGEITTALAGLRGSTRPRFAPEADLSKKYDYSEFPEPEIEASGSLSSPRTSDGISSIRYLDEAQQAGLSFTYYQSPDSRSHRVRIFESTGGGVSVVDVDSDGRPDVMLTQGEQWPLGRNEPVDSVEFADSLFRNTAAGFVDISEVSGLRPEGGYGQGCSAGDFDNDGFQDLYIGNIGGNRLLRNNGDGTWTDVTAECGLSGSAWTTSCLILDLNGDGHPDLFDVNYLEGETIYTVECGENECSVLNFPGAEDQVQLSNGDGTFRRVPAATPKENAKGLGIAAFYSAPTDLPSLFIANDQVPNHFLKPAGNGTYSDEASLRGVAVNADGRPTACMGIAAADLNGDRRQDLFVTNFESEANCLYLQNEGEFFFDSIRGTRLMSAGLPYVGWGTQFLDADNNGTLDLVVTNGHVADFGREGRQYQMPLQIFRGLGGVDFEDVSTSAGVLFGANILGRSLVRLDWNLDGRQDFLVSAVGTPAILATNSLEGSPHFLRLHLHARTTARDSQGAIVRITCGAAEHWQQLTAGDGYQATNERVLHFGLGGETVVSQIEVTWPSGEVQTLTDVPIDGTMDVVEGHGIWNRPLQ